MTKSVDVNHYFEDILDVDLSGIPQDYTFHIELPKIQIGLDPITIEPLTINPITINPLDVSIRLKEIPSIRTHVPANFSVGVSMLGYELFCVRLCGEAQVITEPYDPNPCEICGEAGSVQGFPIDKRLPATPEVPK
jgi:hypothetical protein